METDNKSMMKSLVERAISGDTEAFALICKRYTRYILYTAMKYVGNEANAADVHQEVLLRMHSGIASLKSPESFHGWLNRIIINESNRFVSKEMQEKGTHQIEEYADVLMEKSVEFLPSALLENKEQRALLLKIIDDLPINQHHVIFMYYYQEMSYKEIAAELGLSEMSVAQQMTRARKAIKKQLEKHNIKSVKNFTTNASIGLPVLAMLFRDQAAEHFGDAVVEQVLSLNEALFLAPITIPAGGAAVAAGVAAATQSADAATKGAAAALNPATILTAAVLSTTLITSTVIATMPKAVQAPPQNPSPAVVAPSQEAVDAPSSVPVQPAAESAPAPAQTPPGNSAPPPAAPSAPAAPGETPSPLVTPEPSASAEPSQTPEDDDPPPAIPAHVQAAFAGQLKLKTASGQAVDPQPGMFAGASVSLLKGEELLETIELGDSASFLFEETRRGTGNYTLQVQLPDRSPYLPTGENKNATQTVFLRSNGTSASTFFFTRNDSPIASIKANGSDCECGHVNPKTLHFGDGAPFASLRYSITRLSDQQRMYEGSAASFDCATLPVTDQPTTYLVECYAENEVGAAAVDRLVIVVDPGEILPNQYE